MLEKQDELRKEALKRKQGALTRLRIETEAAEGEVLSLSYALKDISLSVLPLVEMRMSTSSLRSSVDVNESAGKNSDDHSAMRPHWFHRMPAAVSKVASLREVYLDGTPLGNEVTVAVDALATRKEHPLLTPIFACEGVEVLSLSHCGLKSIPDGVADMASLRKLVLSNNDISKLPGDPVLNHLGSHERLAHLDLGSNSLRKLTIQGIGYLGASLKTLILQDSKTSGFQ